MAWAESQYHHCLLESPEAEPARQYLARPRDHRREHREIPPRLLARIAGTGSSTRPRAARLAREGARSDRAVWSARDDGSRYDRFRGRVLFSIRDAQGRPVGLGGRVLPESGATSPAKYVNSPETPLFTKSKLLYGLDVAKDAIAARAGTALVMEGYTD